MGVGTSLVLLAVGAILAFAVNIHSTIASTTVHWHTVGWILLVVGIIGILLSMIFWSSWAGPGYWSQPRRRTYIDEGGPGEY